MNLLIPIIHSALWAAACYLSYSRGKAVGYIEGMKQWREVADAAQLATQEWKKTCEIQKEVADAWKARAQGS